jgi:hypothetical protein
VGLKVESGGVGTLTLGELKLSPAHAQIARVATGLEDPNYSDVIAAARRATGETAEILSAIAQSYKRPRLPDHADLIGSRGTRSAKKVGVVTLRAQTAPLGESEDQRAMRAFMKGVSIGQPEAVEPFVKLLDEHNSELRLTPPFMAVIGLPKRGQQQAIEAFAGQAVGPKAYVPIDLSRTDQDTEVVSALSPALLKQRALSVKSKQHRRLVIHITGLSDAARSPTVATALKRLLTAREDSKDYVPATFIFEIAAEGDPKEKLIAALDGSGSESSWVNAYAVQSHAKFGALDAEAMATYAIGALEDIFQQTRALAPHHLSREMAAEVRQALGDALATPHMPLEELRPRLEYLIRSRIKGHAIQNPKGAVFRLARTPEAEKDPSLQRQLIEGLHKPNADYGQLDKLFWFIETARVGDLSKKRSALIASGREALAALSAARSELEGIPAGVARVLKDAPAAAARQLKALEQSFERGLAEADKNLTYDQLLSYQTQGEIARAIERSSAFVVALGNEAGGKASAYGVISKVLVVQEALASLRTALGELSEGDVAPKAQEVSLAKLDSARIGVVRALAREAVESGDRTRAREALEQLAAGVERPPQARRLLDHLLEYWSLPRARAILPAVLKLMDGKAIDPGALLAAAWDEKVLRSKARSGELPTQELNGVQALGEVLKRRGAAGRIVQRVTDEHTYAVSIEELKEGVREGKWRKSIVESYLAAAGRLGLEPDQRAIDRWKAKLASARSENAEVARVQRPVVRPETRQWYVHGHNSAALTASEVEEMCSHNQSWVRHHSTGTWTPYAQFQDLVAQFGR